MTHEILKIKTTNTHLPLNLLYITHSTYDVKEWHSTPHSHQFTELFYIKEGNGSFLIDGKEVPVSKRDLIIINPNIQHTEMSSETNSLEYLALGFDGFSFTSPKDTIYHNSAHIHPERENSFEKILDIILKEMNDKQNNYEIVCQNLLEILIIQIIREGDYTFQETESKRINSNVFSTKNYIDKNFKEEITLEKLADISHMNKYYLAHSFKEAFGISPIEYLNDIRINEAKILLETTDYSIAEISDVIGFSSQSYFSQFFKAKLSKTPSTYRKVKKHKE